MGPRAGLDVYGKSRPHRNSIPGPSSVCHVAIPIELSRPTGVDSLLPLTVSGLAPSNDGL